MNKPNKIMTSLRLTPDGQSILHQLADKLGVSQANVAEMAIRAMGERENIKPAKRETATATDQ